MSKLDQMRDKFAAARAELKDHSHNAVKEWLEQWLSENPKVLAIRWTQYTPYFNDGDPCVFGVHEPGFKVEGVNEAEFMDSWELKGHITEAMAEFSAKVQDLDLSEVMEAAFGDHVEVVVTRGAIVVNSHDHD